MKTQVSCRRRAAPGSWPRRLLLAAAVLLPAAWLTAADWSQWRGPHRDGAAPESPPLLESLPADGLRPQWISQERIPGGGNGGWSSPLVAAGKVYLSVHWHTRRPGVELPPEEFPPLSDEQRQGMSEAELTEYEEKRRQERRDRARRLNRYVEAVYCLDAATGETVWKNERESVHTQFPQSGSPAVVTDRLYTLGADRKLRCLDAQTGQERWAAALPVALDERHISSSVAVVGEVAVVLAGKLFGVDAQSGQLLWQTDEGGGDMNSSPVVWSHGGRQRVIANQGGQAVCIDPQDGRELWRVESHASRSTPVVVGDCLITYGHSRKQGLRCFDLSPEKAELRWTFQGLSDSGSSPVVVNGHVYVQGARRLACVDLETGRPAWRTTLNVSRARYTSLIAADNKVFYVAEGLLCFAASPEQYQPLLEGKFDEQGLLASEAHFRKTLGLDQLERTGEGQQQAERLWQEKIARQGPLECASPAIADGKLYVRLNNAVACYDLTSSLGQENKSRKPDAQARGAGSASRTR